MDLITQGHETHEYMNSIALVLKNYRNLCSPESIIHMSSLWHVKAFDSSSYFPTMEEREFAPFSQSSNSTKEFSENKSLGFPTTSVTVGQIIEHTIILPTTTTTNINIEELVMPTSSRLSEFPIVVNASTHIFWMKQLWISKHFWWIISKKF